MSDISQALGPLNSQFYSVETRIDLATNTGPIKFLAANALRWAIVFSCPVDDNGIAQQGNLTIVSSTIKSMKGIVMTASSTPLIMVFREVGSLVTMEWDAANPTAVTVHFSAIEVLIQQ